MNRIVFLLLFVAISSKSFSQNESETCPYLKKAAELFCDEKYATSARVLKKFSDLFSTHMLAQEALYAEGLCYYNSGKIKKASKVLNELMKLQSYNDADTFGYSILLCNYLQNDCKNILIPDFLVNLQHEACILLFHIAMKEKSYDEAYNHLDDAQRYYRYWYGCGTNDMQESIRLAMLFSDYFDVVNKKDTAVFELLPHLFEPSAFPITNYEDLVKMTAVKLKTLYGERAVQEALTTSVSNIFYESTPDGHGHVAHSWYIRFYGKKIKIAPDYLFGKTDNPADVQNYLRQSLFYSIVFNLGI